MRLPTLDQTQRLFWKLITAPEGAATGVAQLPPADRAVAASLARGDARLSALDRLDVYADMYFYRIRDCLQEDFTTVCAVVGARPFHNLITDYLIAHPPSHFSLRYAGEHLPAFVETHALSQRWPYLRDVALLEWSIIEAFDAPDAAPLAAAALTAIPEARWPEIRFELTPSLRVLRLGWPVHDIWQQAQDGAAPGELTPETIALRVWRQDLRVFHRPIATDEHHALMAIDEGAPFAEVCERIVTAAGDADGADRASQLLGEWVADGLLTGFSFS